MKTKVIAFRVTQDEYDGLVLAAAEEARSVGEYVRRRLVMQYHVERIGKERKRLEAKAKRAAKKAATIEAANAPE